jgi:hypothetical protein
VETKKGSGRKERSQGERKEIGKSEWVGKTEQFECYSSL